MKRNINNIGMVPLTAIMLMLASCEPKQAILPSWLEGTWETGDSLGLVTESWEKISNEYMTGEGLFVSKSGKTIIEILNIFIRDGVLFYTAMLPNQNNGEEIMFIDTGNKPDSLVFENPTHDYPKKIVYHKKQSGMIEVFIFGSKDEQVNIITLKKAAE